MTLSGKPQSDCMWIPEARPEARVRLLIAHHAGGSSGPFFKLAKALPPSIEAVLIELPGRGARRAQKPLVRMPDVIQALLEGFQRLPPKPTALFGHSMGGMIMFELAHALSSLGLTPVHAFISSARFPSFYQQRGNLLNHSYSDEWLTARLRAQGGTPEAVLENREMLDIILPIYRADFELLDSYVPTQLDPLSVPATMLGGDSDPDVSPEQLGEWSALWNPPCRVEIFKGGHFYLFDQQKQLIELITTRLFPT